MGVLIAGSGVFFTDGMGFDISRLTPQNPLQQS